MSKKRKFNNQPKAVEMTQETQSQETQVLNEQEAVLETAQSDSQVSTTEDTQTEQKGLQEPVEAVVEAVVAVEQPVVVEPVVQVVATEPVAQPVAQAPVAASKYSEGLTRLLDLCKQSNSTPLNNYVNELLDYAQKMAPGQTMNRESGAANQAAFYNTLICIVDHTGKDFRLGFATMLAIFNEYKKGAFSGTHVLRFMEDVPLNKNKRDSFIKMVNLFSMTADSKTRKMVLKHLDLKRELAHGVSEEGRARIASFYAV